MAKIRAICMTAGEDCEFDENEEAVIQYWYDQGNIVVLFGQKIEEDEDEVPEEDDGKEELS